MYYDQLLALYKNLRDLYVHVLRQENMELEARRIKLLEIKIRMQEVQKKLKNAKGWRYPSALSYQKAREFKKTIKNEFLLQAKDGYSISNIVVFMEENYLNPGVNLEKYIEGLREKGYFYYQDLEDQDSSLIITDKSQRYLENEANVSLKK